eukprot:Gb_00831 [translate_table: standard]
MPAIKQTKSCQEISKRSNPPSSTEFADAVGDSQFYKLHLFCQEVQYVLVQGATTESVVEDNDEDAVSDDNEAPDVTKNGTATKARTRKTGAVIVKRKIIASGPRVIFIRADVTTKVTTLVTNPIGHTAELSLFLISAPSPPSLDTVPEHLHALVGDSLVPHSTDNLMLNFLSSCSIPLTNLYLTSDQHKEHCPQSQPIPIYEPKPSIQISLTTSAPVNIPGQKLGCVGSIEVTGAYSCVGTS